MKSLREVIAQFEYFWVWFDGEWHLGRLLNMGFFETLDHDGIDYLEHENAPAIGISVPEKPPEKSEKKE